MILDVAKMLLLWRSVNERIFKAKIIPFFLKKRLKRKNCFEQKKTKNIYKNFLKKYTKKNIFLL